MSAFRSSMNNISQTKSDQPPMSRLFIICSRYNDENDFRRHFDQFGNIEDIWIVKDKNTGENKGVAYIKFSKTTEAARALEEMDGKSIDDSGRTLKVLVAASRNASNQRNENEKEKYIRLFIVVNKTQAEDELRDEFSKYGDIDAVNIVKDRNTGQSKGFAYIKYTRFTHAADAFENCPQKYKAVFAEPKSVTNSKDRNNDFGSNTGNRRDNNRDRGRYDDDDYIGGYNRRGNDRGGSGRMGMSFDNGRFDNNYTDFDMPNFKRMQFSVNQPTSLEVIASSSVNQDQLWRLFDIVPGLDYCHITRELLCFSGGPRTNEINVVYTNPEAAMYAKEKLHGLEYPPGERLIVKLSGVDVNNDPKFVNHQLNKESICSVPLGPAQPLAGSDSTCAKRCFIVLSSNLPISILKNVFCTFGGLIDVYLLPNKNCGYVKYTTEESARKAIEALNGAEICDVRLKVMEAEEQRNAPKRQRTS